MLSDTTRIHAGMSVRIARLVHVVTYVGRAAVFTTTNAYEIRNFRRLATVTLCHKETL